MVQHKGWESEANGWANFLRWMAPHEVMIPDFLRREWFQPFLESPILRGRYK